MVVAGPVMPAKRRLEETENDKLHERGPGPVVIELSDSDSQRETSSSIPPSKRHKSRTRTENGARSSSVSRVKLEKAKTTVLSTPTDTVSHISQPERSRFTAARARLTSSNGISDRLFPKRPVTEFDLTGDSSPSPRLQSPSGLPTRNAKPSTTPGSPLLDKVQEVRQANSYRSPYIGSGLSFGTRSNSVAIERERRKIVQKFIPLTNVSVEVPRITTAERRDLATTQRSSQQAHITVEVDKLEQLPKSGAEREAEKNRLFSQLRLSTKLVHENPALVERYFGQTGYSKAFSVEDEEEHAFMKRAASKKKRRVKRTDIKLEIESISRSVEGLQLNKQLIHPSLTGRAILLSRFDEQGSPPLTFSNDVNDKILHGKFQFLNQYIIGEKVRPAPPSTNRGCECTDCSLGSCICVTTSKSYTRRPDGMVVLSDEYIKREIDPAGPHSEITECNELCRCGQDCFNRVVGKGCTVPLEIFHTKKCGYGARSSQNIVKGQFIEVYFGEVITLAELLRREDAENDDDPSYIYSLDWFTGTTNNAIYYVDGKYCGSAMRFVNHSCNPNARCFTVQTHKEDRKLYYLAFFAIRDIPAGTEIRIDYRGERASKMSSQEEADSHQANGEDSDDLVKCHCGEKNCRGTFWIPGVKARRRRRKRQ
ncbi:hypothetical protein PV04_02425 [Phialophora macrospora]|uniref:SET domain-containing protein n=1 Tax=Phialophora macrospora TaxID=1851006 RepID=A0A0D2FPA4_9EURO|nr:hypothetical protein PV04_02425 [Phialophora macrospora]